MATILDLLMALNRDELPPVPAPAQPVPMAPAPTGNVPEFGGPSQVTEPPQAPINLDTIRQMLALRGPAPTPPAPRSKAERIFNALAGFGAGFQGNGAQFLQQLQEPQREYKRQLERYNQEGTDLGVRALERAQREQEQKTRRAQEVSDQQLQAEFQRETRRLRLTDDREKALLEDMLVSRRQREHDERAAEEARRKEKADKEEQRNKIYADLVKAPNYTPTKIANEIADNIISGKPMSASAEKWRSLQVRKLEKQLAGLKGGGGTGGGKTMAVLEGGQTIPVSLVDQKTGRVIIDGKPVKVVGYTGGGASTPKTAAPQGQQNDPLGIR